MKAEGGWAAVCTEYAAVSPDSDEAPYAHVRVWDDGDLAHIGLMAEQAHAAGALAGIELFHSGAHGHNADSHLPSHRPVADRERLQRLRPAGDDEGRHPARPGRLGEGRGARRATPATTSSTRTARTRYLLGAVPVAVLQPAQRRVRRLAA